MVISGSFCFEFKRRRRFGNIQVRISVLMLLPIADTMVGTGALALGSIVQPAKAMSRTAGTKLAGARNNEINHSAMGQSIFEFSSERTIYRSQFQML